MERATAPEARTRPLEQLSGVLRMMFAVASVKRAETAFPGLHGAVEVVTRGRHVEQLSGREHLAVPGDPLNIGMGWGTGGHGLGL